MAMTEAIIKLGELSIWPDWVSRAVIEWQVSRTARKLQNGPAEAKQVFAEAMAGFPIATHTGEANTQHYEVPAAFFNFVLGPHRKYSCCLFEEGAETLAEAEARALSVTAQNALLQDGQSILELGCGWGSMTLWMARHYPLSRIVAVSNSGSQRDFIMREAAALGLRNVEVVTADMNAFVPDKRFDRIISIEMFEHMANWHALLARLHECLKPDGFLYLHFFSHRSQPYRFDHTDPSDWIAHHFFTGGIMPSHSLIREFGNSFTVDEDWRWNGIHYQKTADAWLENFERHQEAIMEIFSAVYGSDARVWLRRWRLFFLATSGLFGHGNGEPWGVSHFRLKPVQPI